MELKDFETASYEEQELMAIRFNSRIRADDHAFAAMVARICGTAGPKAVHADEGSENNLSLHGLEG